MKSGNEYVKEYVIEQEGNQQEVILFRNQFFKKNTAKT